jgi:uncharacterized protein involved in exopolysaccharide biosynthesis/Mrp family chromosome partitioning ATPase
MMDAAREDGWEVVRKVWRRKWLVLATATGFIMAGAFLAALVTPRFAAEARVLLGIQEPRVVNIESVLKGITPNTETMQSEAYVIGSRELARSVAYRLALDKSPEFNLALRPDNLAWLRFLDPTWLFDFIDIKTWFGKDNGTEVPPSSKEQLSEEEKLWERVVSRLLDRVEVTPLNRSHVLSTRVESEEPFTAARIANTFAEVYVEQHLTRKQRATDRANEWLQSRIEELQWKVQESGRAVEEYRREHGLYQTKSDTVIAQQLAALNQELVASENAKAEADGRLAQAEAQLDKSSTVETLPAVLQSPLIRTLRAQQADLEKQAAELSSTYTRKHPRVRDIRAQIAEIKSKIATEAQRIVQGLRHEARLAQDRYTRVVARMEELKNQMGQANEQTLKLQDLEREAQANRTMLETLLRRSKETIDQQHIQTSDAEIISRASVPLRPSFPPTNLILLLAAIAGLGGGVLLALLVENLDQTFRTGDEVEEYTGLPSLALVPMVRKRRRPAEHVVQKPYSNFTGSLRMLGARLFLASGTSSKPGLIMFTSALPGEGKSLISSSFAQLMALDGRRVIILDLDWKQPNLHRMFGQSRGVGLADLLNGDITPKQAVFRDRQSGAHVMFAGNVGQIRENTAWFERLRLLLDTLSRHYDVIILDTSPVLVAPEVLYLARLVSKTVLIAKWGSTPRRVVASELKSLLRAGAPVAGIVLSQVDPRRYNQYGYGDAGYLRPRHLGLDAG